MADYVPDADFNGDAFVIGAEGERYEAHPAYVVVMANEAPYTNAMYDFADDGKWATVAPNANQRNAFLIANYARVRNFVATDAVAARIAFYRLLAVKYRLISLSHTADNCYIRVIEHANVNPVQLGGQAVPGDVAAGNALAVELTGPNREALRVKFMNYVCLLAWVFRVRGHHYLPDFAGTLERVWTKMRYEVADIPIAFDVGFTIALHAIPPVVLEAAWHKAARMAYIDGALIKRLDSAPAGAAIIPTIDRGLKDIGVVIQQMPGFVQESYALFITARDGYYGNELSHSVNARLYNLNRVRIQEERFGILAAYIMGVYEYAAEEAPLRSSKALDRVAKSNPVTLGLMASATRFVFEKYAGDMVYGPVLRQIMAPPSNQ